MSAYRNLIDWDIVETETSAGILHCFDSMSAGDYSLISLASLMRDYLLETSEEELLALAPGTIRDTVVFHATTKPPVNMPEELQVIRRAKEEIPFLESYPVEFASQVLRGGIPPQAATRGKESSDKSWAFAMTSDFRQAIMKEDKKLKGSVMNAIVKEICESPTTQRGDTVKPLKGRLAGHWRYRLADYRLIYLPDEATQTVVLIDIGARGSIYVGYE